MDRLSHKRRKGDALHAAQNMTDSKLAPPLESRPGQNSIANSLIDKAKLQWLKRDEVMELLSRHVEFELPVSNPQREAKGGRLFLVDCTSLRKWRACDGEEWNEAHTTPPQGKGIITYYATARNGTGLKRRAHWLNRASGNSNIRLVQYLHETELSSRESECTKMPMPDKKDRHVLPAANQASNFFLQRLKRTEMKFRTSVDKQLNQRQEIFPSDQQDKLIQSLAQERSGSKPFSLGSSWPDKQSASTPAHDQTASLRLAEMPPVEKELGEIQSIRIDSFAAHHSNSWDLSRYFDFIPAFCLRLLCRKNEPIVLGHGSLGTVLKGEFYKIPVPIPMAIPVAIKSLKTEDVDYQRRILEEVKSVQDIRFPTITQIYGVCTFRKGLALVMEFAEDGSLQQHLKDRYPVLCWYRRGRALMQQVAQGLQYIHEHHHRPHLDLKPSNILLSNGIHTAKIADFGLGRMRFDSKAKPTTLQSSDYIAPECMSGMGGLPADVYALGTIMHAVFTLALPTENPTILQERCPNPRDLIHRCRSFHPSERPKIAEVCQWFNKV